MTGGVRDKGRGDSSLRMTNTPNLHSIEIDGDRKSKILEITNKAMQTIQQERGAGADCFTGLSNFLTGYKTCALESDIPADEYKYLINVLIKLVPECARNPFKFPYYHSLIKEPYDLYSWGNRFISTILDLDKSTFQGAENLPEIRKYLARNENVFLFSNHQTEADPQVTSLLFDKEGFQDLSERLISVAGHRVTTDPVCMPFSMGRNLFCIYSKKHMENPPNLKHAKQSHNMNTIKTMVDMLSDPNRGHLIWVAPSGGRDRPDPKTGRFNIAPFDPKSVEMFRIIAKKAEVSSELGEARVIGERHPASIAIGQEIVQTELNKLEFAHTVEDAVQRAYNKLDEYHMAQS